MTEKSRNEKPTDASAVELTEDALDKASGGMNVSLNSSVVAKKKLGGPNSLCNNEVIEGPMD